MTAEAGYAVLRLMDYPSWRVTVDDNPALGRPVRDDGLMTVPIRAGKHVMEVQWAATRDVIARTHNFRHRIAGAGRSWSDAGATGASGMITKMQQSVQEILSSSAELIDQALDRLLPGPDQAPVSIHRAMRHSVFAGGKRLRPVLCMEAARMICGSGQLPAGVEELGAAIEMLHTYSLIHDDLPALDNDDLRRGKPTCHVVFGEAIAILAGDALQTQAYEVLAGLQCSAAADSRDCALHRPGYGHG